MNSPNTALKIVPLPIPNPTPCQPLDEDSSAERRRLHCRRYDACLNVAVERDWPSFACDACDAYEPLTEAEEARDEHGLLQLADLITNPRE